MSRAPGRVAGFTGTQRGMTLQQKSSVRVILLRWREHLNYNMFHHGGCIGADAEAQDIAFHLGYKIVVHPPVDKRKMAEPIDDYLPIYREPKLYLERNEDIARECDALIATPRGEVEVRRSGTWSTIRRARRLGKWIAIVLPDGSIRWE